MLVQMIKICAPQHILLVGTFNTLTDAACTCIPQLEETDHGSLEN